MEADLRDLTNSVESLKKNYLELEELCHVLQFTNPYFEHVSLLFIAFFHVFSGSSAWCNNHYALKCRLMVFLDVIGMWASCCHTVPKCATVNSISFGNL